MGLFSGLLGFGSSLLGGFLGKKEKDKDREYADAVNRNKIQWTVEDAKKAGVSPLAALGSPSSGAWATPAGQSNFGSAVADAGKSLAPILNKEAVRKAKLENDYLMAQIEGTKAQTAATRTAATRMTLGGGAPLTIAPRGQAVDDIAHIEREKGSYERYNTESGQTVDMPVGPDIGEILGGILVEGRGYTKAYPKWRQKQHERLAQYYSNLFGYSGNKSNKRGSSQSRRKGRY